MSAIPVKNCCGCTACYNICPTSAIQMKADAEGFAYPVINSDLCCDCKKCETVCPILHTPSVSENFADCVIAQSDSEAVLDESSSGGFVDALCKHFIENCNGYVAGVAYDSEFMPCHVIVNTYDEAKAFRNSKYAQSDLSDIFSQIKKLLDDKKHVMFVGTPCQAAGLKAFLQKDYDTLFTVDLVCRSIPSPKLWRLYLDYQKKRFGSQIKSVFCRKKTYGYHSGTLNIEFENGRCYKGSNRVDWYMKAFHSDICSRPSCYECHFKSKHRCSDFTVFDCWKPHLVTQPPVVDNDKGYSNVLIHTAKGKALADGIKNISVYHTDPDKLFSVMGSMVAKSIKYNGKRDTFYTDLENSGFDATVKKYVSISLKDRVIEKLKPVRYFFNKK